MTATELPNECTPSTTWAWKRVKIASAAGGPVKNDAKGGRFHGLHRRNPREALTITIVSRGGPEAWWEIRARGRVVRFPGHLCIEDVFREINQS